MDRNLVAFNHGQVEGNVFPSSKRINNRIRGDGIGIDPPAAVFAAMARYRNMLLHGGLDVAAKFDQNIRCSFRQLWLIKFIHIELVLLGRHQRRPD